MRLQRLNQDATWWVEHGGATVLFDPWLVGSEVDVAPWFNEAWHTGPVVPPEAAPPHDLVIVSQHYADHCHPATLARLPDAPTVVVPQAAAAARAARREVHVLPGWDERPLTLRGLRLWRLSRPWWRPPAYHVVVVVDGDGRAVVHAPHGLPAAEAAAIAARVDVALLATTRLSYRLPFFLGGAVNPGPEAADRARAACRARHALAVHDEPKRQRGLVARLARVDREAAAPPGWLDPGAAPLHLDQGATGS